MERLYSVYVFYIGLIPFLYAVQVSIATLKDGSSTVSGQLQVVSGVTKTLTCETSVSKPAAIIVWYIGTQEKQRSISKTFTFNPQNSDHTKQVYCKAFNTQPESQAVVSYKSSIYVTVQVSIATLKDGSSTVSGQLQVVSGISKTLTCETSVSRPAATIVWYIGTQEKQRSTSKTFTFNPQNSDHTKRVYCKAFNTQPESQAVTSYKASLNVQVQVSIATLKDGSNTVSGQLQVVSGVTKTLTCETSVSKPAATIVWYIGTQEKQRSISKTFTFNPQNSDHTKQVYCKAFNTQPESQAVVSYKSSIYVTVHATTPTLTNKTTGSMILLENDPITMECITSATRPAATVTWWKGSSSLTNIQNTNISQGNLISVKSVVSFTPRKADDRKVIFCQSFVSGQDNRPSAQQAIKVYWPPATPSIPTLEFPFLENQTGKSIYCSSKDYGNPASTARWHKQYGTPDNSDSRRLNLPTMTSQMDGSSVSCQLDNYFTLVKGSTIKSPSVKLEVEYNPITHIMVDGIITKSVAINEGQTLSVLCNATGNPTPTVKWIGQTLSSTYLTFHDIDRTNHGIYTCRAEATSEKYRNHDFVTETIIDIIVDQKQNTDKNVSVKTGAIAGGLIVTVIAIIVIVVISVIIVKKRKSKQEGDKAITETERRLTYESLQTVSEAQTTYSSLSYETGDKAITETERRLTYESLQTVSEAQTTYSSLSYETDQKRRQEDKMYENLRMQQMSLSTI
ncbi:hemicentin-2-like [Ruditapes philippinarum]|uniref:hemicentin-2-like n=1 Tax=Ruditapes philippinarum TaxID=129788 RepID=UPI00295BB2BC|nr:hemicentin-2-like [Ruditapes philippinarum]